MKVQFVPVSQEIPEIISRDNFNSDVSGMATASVPANNQVPNICAFFVVFDVLL